MKELWPGATVVDVSLSSQGNSPPAAAADGSHLVSFSLASSACLVAPGQVSTSQSLLQPWMIWGCPSAGWWGWHTHARHSDTDGQNGGKFSGSCPVLCPWAWQNVHSGRSPHPQQPGAWWESYLCSYTVTVIMVRPRWWCASHQSSWHDRKKFNLSGNISLRALQSSSLKTAI